MGFRSRESYDRADSPAKKRGPTSRSAAATGGGGEDRPFVLTPERILLGCSQDISNIVKPLITGWTGVGVSALALPPDGSSAPADYLGGRRRPDDVFRRFCSTLIITSLGPDPGPRSRVASPVKGSLSSPIHYRSPVSIPRREWLFPRLALFSYGRV